MRGVAELSLDRNSAELAPLRGREFDLRRSTMATTLPSDSQLVGFPPGTVSPAGREEYSSLYGVAGCAEDVEARTHQLSLLVEVNAALAGALDVESVLGDILARLADRERLTHARIYRLDESAGELQRVAWGGRDGGPQRAVSLQDPTLLAWAIQHRRRSMFHEPIKTRAASSLAPTSNVSTPYPSKPARVCSECSTSQPISRTDSVGNPQTDRPGRDSSRLSA